MYDIFENSQVKHFDSIRDDWEYMNNIAYDSLYAIEYEEFGEYEGKPTAYYIRKFLDNARDWRTPYASKMKEHFRDILKYEGVWLWVKDVFDEYFKFKVDIYITNPLGRKKPILLPYKMENSLDYLGDLVELAMYECRTYTPSASIIVDKGSVAEREIDKYIAKKEAIGVSQPYYEPYLLPIKELNLIKR